MCAYSHALLLSFLIPLGYECMIKLVDACYAESNWRALCEDQLLRLRLTFSLKEKAQNQIVTVLTVAPFPFDIVDPAKRQSILLNSFPWNIYKKRYEKLEIVVMLMTSNQSFVSSDFNSTMCGVEIFLEVFEYICSY